MGNENQIETITTGTFYYVIDGKINVKLVAEKARYIIKEHGKKFPTRNIIQMRENIQFKISVIGNNHEAMAKIKQRPDKII